jgi:hypothetical protein
MMSAAVAGTIPRPEIPATRTLHRRRRSPENASQSSDLIPIMKKVRPTASYTNPRDVTFCTLAGGDSDATSVGTVSG